MVSPIGSFLARHWDLPAAARDVHVEPIHGGLESTVLRARAPLTDGSTAAPRQVVIKLLDAELAREADIYDALWCELEPPPAVRVFGRDVSSERTYLYLEHAQTAWSWPWCDVGRPAAVCRVLARLHDRDALPRSVFTWDYETALARSAEETLAVADRTRDEHGARPWTRMGDLRRVVADLAALRAHLRSAGQSVIHGDMHPGNVVLRGPADADVVLLDWARARIGSPLEDVASWLHSLGCWEPQARRRHDTLMRIYLEARRRPRALTAEVRALSWFASASNGLAGAIRHHLVVLSDPRRPPADRDQSRWALHAWARVITRAAALLRPSRDRRTSARGEGRHPPTRSPSP